MNSVRRMIWTLMLVSFCNGLQLSIYYSTLWPYASSVDSHLSVIFFGCITAAFSVGQSLSSIIFGFWMDRSHSPRNPFICGLSFMSLANLIFCLAQATSPYVGTLIILLSRILLGFGAGTISLTRAIAPNVGRQSARSIAMVQCAYSVGCTLGPSLQYIFTLLGQMNNVSLLPGLNMYTAGPFLLAILNVIVTIPVNLYLDEDMMRKRKITGMATEFPTFERQKYTRRDHFTVAMVITTIFIVMLIVANVDSILSAYAELMWGWRNEESVKYIGNFHTLHGITQIIVYFVVSCLLTQYITGQGAVFTTILGLFFAMFFYTLTYPYAFFGSPISCQTMSWCSETYTVNVLVFGFAFSIVLAMAYPIIGIATNVIFCNASGDTNQGTLMGVMISIANIGKILGPMVVTYMYEHFGPKVIWISMMFLISCCITYWIFHLQRRKDRVVHSEY